MIAVHCAAHGSRVLLGLDAIERLTATPSGTRVAFMCHCGNRGVEVFSRG